MKLYLDNTISKALGQSSGAKETPDEKQAIQAYETSFEKDPIGEAPGEAVDNQDDSKPVKKAQPFDGGFTSEEAARAAESLGIDFNSTSFDLSAFTQGMNAEREHSDVSKEAGVIGKIAHSHLKEDPKYYDKLEEMEKSEASNILKSFCGSMDKYIRKADPLEEEFLLSKGFTMKDIHSPSLRINSTLRSEFNSWLCSRLVLDPRDILGR